MNLRDARYFVVASEAPSFGVAAQRCFLTQQAFSAAMARLERDLGETLFDRTPHGISLTEAGERLLPNARALADLADRTMASVHATADDASGGALRVGIMQPAAAELTSPIVQAFRAAHPGVAVAVRELRFSGVADKVLARDVDVAIAVGPVDGPSLDVTPLFCERRAMLLPRHHELAGAKELSITDVLDLTFLPGAALPRDWIGFWRLEAHRNGDPACVASTQVAEAHTPSEVNEVVAAGVGVVTGPLSHRRAFPHQGVIAVPLDDATGSVVSAVVPSCRRPALAEAFVAAAVEVSHRLVELVDDAWVDEPTATG